MLIDEKLFFQNKLKYCELYHENCCLIQCFKYQKYEHITWICHQNQKCSFCAILKYNDHSCVFWNELNRHYCTNYKEFYSAWFFKCKTRQKQIEKVWLIYSIKSCRYAKALTILIKLDKNIQKNLFQILLNQSSTVLITI